MTLFNLNNYLLERFVLFSTWKEFVYLCTGVWNRTLLGEGSSNFSFWINSSKLWEFDVFIFLENVRFFMNVRFFSMKFRRINYKTWGFIKFSSQWHVSGWMYGMPCDILCFSAIDFLEGSMFESLVFIFGTKDYFQLSAWNDQFCLV